VLGFPGRDDEMAILRYHLPFARPDLLALTVEFLQQAHALKLDFSPRDGIHLLRYAIKRMAQDPQHPLTQDDAWREALAKVFIFLPLAISLIGATVIWKFVYAWAPPSQPQYGLLNAIWTGLGNQPIAWATTFPINLPAEMVILIWLQTGFAMVVLSAALKGIPTEIIEAARVDGAGEWNIFRRIMLPMLSLPISIVSVWLFINVIKVFDIIYVMTDGGPGTSSRVIAYSMYKETFYNAFPGKGAAIAVIMLLFLIPVMILNIRRFKSERVMT